MIEMSEYQYQETMHRKLRESVCVAATARVMKFDKEKLTVNVQPLSKHLEHGDYVSQPPILRIPVICMRLGGFIFRPWIEVDDVGIIVYLDHDMDATVTAGREAEPLTERNHATTDAIFLGGIVSGSYMVKGLPDEAHVLAKEDGTIYVAVARDRVTIKNEDTIANFFSDKIEMKSQEISLEAKSNFYIKGNDVYIN